MLMSFDLVFFGGTGDLTWRKLMPALFQAFRHGKLPPDGRILAVARDDQTDEQYRAWLKTRFQDVELAKRPSDEEFAAFAGMLHYRRMDLSQPDHYVRLRQVEAPVMQHLGEPGELFFAGPFGQFDILEALLEPRAVLHVGLVVARDGEDAAFGRQLAVAKGLEQRRHQLAPGEVAGAAEENEVE